MDTQTQIIAAIEEHNPELAKMLRWHADHDVDNPVKYTLDDITEIAALDDNEFLILAMACWMYVDNHRGEMPMARVKDA